LVLHGYLSIDKYFNSEGADGAIRIHYSCSRKSIIKLEKTENKKDAYGCSISDSKKYLAFGEYENNVPIYYIKIINFYNLKS
jgi:hypothetical protein